MRISWAKPSLSRDFTLLAAAIFFVLVIISGWVIYSTYIRHAEKIVIDLEKEAERVDNALTNKMESANYMLASLGRQIVLESTHDYTRLAQSLKAFDSKDNLFSIFSWTTPDKKMVVSSNRGVLETPLDISDRDFIQQSSVDSWKIHIGRPIEGRVSERWVIPVGMGVTDYTGKFIGIVSLSIDIKTLIGQIGGVVKRDGMSFSIVNKQLIPIAEINPTSTSGISEISRLADIDFSVNSKGLFEGGSLVFGTGRYAYYKLSENYPYIIMVNYDANYGDGDVRLALFARLLQIFMIALFFMMFLWLVKMRVIKPVLAMTEAASAIARGERKVFITKNRSVEIDALATQLVQIEKYITETKLVEEELKNKIFTLKKAKENADISSRSKSEFLAYITQEIRSPLNNIIGFSQTLKDQMYGPIENKKYKQYSSDIFATSNQLMSKMQDVLQYSKLETGYVSLQDKEIILLDAINASIQQINDKIHTHKNSIKLDIDEHFPNIIADDFRFQQIITNSLLALLDNIEPKAVVIVNAVIVTEYRDKKFCVVTVFLEGGEDYPKENLLKLSDSLDGANNDYNIRANAEQNPNIDIKIEIVRWLVHALGGAFDLEMGSDNKIKRILFLLPESRMVKEDII